MIELRDVSKQFAGKRRVTALERLSLPIPRGEMVAIVGPSGSGKSTLLNLVGALDRPSSRQVVIVTHDMTVAESCERTIALRDGRIEADIRRSTAAART